MYGLYQVFGWPVRGPRIVQRIAALGADVVALQEYDCEAEEADYLGDGRGE